jgi:membrane peptidoglycan carboxypeptidase
VFLFAWAAGYEARTSALQAFLLSRYAARLSYSVEAGPSSRIVFPRGGPFNEQRGYTRLPEFERRLLAQGFTVKEQARISADLAWLVGWGVPPPYREPASTGLVIRGSDAQVLFDGSAPARLFRSQDEVPNLVARSLLTIENRELQQPADPRSNPAVEYDRLLRAGVLYLGRGVGLPLPVEGGSTLATQLEKYRYSEHGRTSSAGEKLRQIAAASLKAYGGGVDTRPWRQEILLDYLNTVPLAATAATGEVHGVGEGLWAWFGLELPAVRAALAPGAPVAERARAFKHVLALLCAVRAPSRYLIQDRRALEARTALYTRLLTRSGAFDEAFAQQVIATRLAFVRRSGPFAAFVGGRSKAVNAVRSELTQALVVPALYDLDRLHLEVESTLDPQLQDDVMRLFERLHDPAFVAVQGLKAERLLATGDPARVVYSLLLFERTPEGDRVRVQADALDQPFDLNQGMKLELGSTAKLRTLACYLGHVARLHRELSAQDARGRAAREAAARDPITKWAAATLRDEKNLALPAFLERALDRRYSASPEEEFFTGGGLHVFGNFDPLDNPRVLSIREATRSSTNLVFIRLMRDLVVLETGLLPYDARAVLADPKHPERRRLLEAAADDEARAIVARAAHEYRGRPRARILGQVLGSRGRSIRDQAIFFYAGHPGADEAALATWLSEPGTPPAADEVHRLHLQFGKPTLTLLDCGSLLRRHPLELWVASQLAQEPTLALADLVSRSGAARRASSAWLFDPGHRHAQDLRLRIRIEEEAFAAMTAEWRRLGFPFERLVPSLATAIGSSGDRPAALAELMGVIVNDGVRRRPQRVRALLFGAGTPYHTALAATPDPGQPMMEAEVARALRGVLADVVARGTARRIAGAFRRADGTPVAAGGKTGSGDNRFQTFGAGRKLISATAVNRTATFVFYVGDRYYGVVTALVAGPEAAGYSFTSALPVSVLRLLAPRINARLGVATAPQTASVGLPDRVEQNPRTVGRDTVGLEARQAPQLDGVVDDPGRELQAGVPGSGVDGIVQHPLLGHHELGAHLARPGHDLGRRQLPVALEQMAPGDLRRLIAAAHEGASVEGDERDF